MASESFSEEKEQRRPTVQVGDPFTEKLLLGSLLGVDARRTASSAFRTWAPPASPARRPRWPAAAAAASSSISRACPPRETGMTPYEILLSESQERMLLVAKQGTEQANKKIFDKWDLDAVVIGRVTGDQQFRALFDGVEVAQIPISALTKEAPALPAASGAAGAPG